MAELTSRAVYGKGRPRGGASLIIGAYWNERRKGWDVVVTGAVGADQTVVRNAKADSSVPIDQALVAEAATTTACWLESLLF